MNDEERRGKFVSVNGIGCGMQEQIKERMSRVPCDVGICNDCSNVECVMDDLGQIGLLYCDHHKRSLNTKRKIKTCTGWVKYGDQGLNAMKEIAWVVDVPNVIGFRKEK